MEPETRPQLHILGACALRLPSRGASDDGLPARTKRFAVLVYLALAGRTGTVQRDKVLSLLWPELDQRRASAALRQSLYLLRRELGRETIVTRGNELRLLPEQLWCDAVAFEGALDAGEERLALSLYRGKLLDGFHLPHVAPEFEHWLDLERERFQRRAIDAAGRLADRAASAGHLEEGIRWTRRAIEFDPTDEGALQRLLVLLDRAGDRSGAVRSYESFARRLQEELEVEPSAESRALLEAIRGRSKAVDTQALVSTEERKTVAKPARGTPPYDTHARRPELRHLRVALASLLALVAILGGWALWPRGGTVEQSVTVAVPPGIAVLPFSVQGNPEFSYLRQGIPDLLSIKLEGAGAFRSVDPSGIATVTANTRIDRETGWRIAGRFDVPYYVLGEVFGGDSTLLITAALYQRGADGPLLRAAVEGPIEQLPALVDQLTARLLVGRFPGESGTLSRAAIATTSSVTALKAFLEGEGHYRAGEYGEAVDAYHRAVNADTSFALAYYGLANAAVWAGRDSLWPIAAEHAERYAHQLGPHHQALLKAQAARLRGYPDHAEAILTSILSEWPNDVEAWRQLGETLFHMNPYRGRSLATSRRPFERLLQLAPHDHEAHIHLLRIAAFEGRSEEVDRRSRRLLERNVPLDLRREALALRASALEGEELTRDLLSQMGDAREQEVFALVRSIAVFGRDPLRAERLSDALLDRRRPRAVRARTLLLQASLAMCRGQWRLAEEKIELAAELAPLETVELQAFHATLPFSPIEEPDLVSIRDSLFQQPDHGYLPIPFESLNPHAGARLNLDGRLSLAVGDSARAKRRAAQLETLGGWSSTREFLAVASEAEQRGRVRRSLEDLYHGTLAADLRARMAQKHLLPEALADVRGAQAQSLPMSLSPPHLGDVFFDRYLHAEVLRELGQYEEALSWYGSVGQTTEQELVYGAPAAYWQGRISERLGDQRGAVRHYGRIIELWGDADPELQGWVRDARRRIEALQTAEGARRP